MKNKIFIMLLRFLAIKPTGNKAFFTGRKYIQLYLFCRR